jgi:hypothetical protein
MSAISTKVFFLSSDSSSGLLRFSHREKARLSGAEANRFVRRHYAPHSASLAQDERQRISTAAGCARKRRFLSDTPLELRDGALTWRVKFQI